MSFKEIEIILPQPSLDLACAKALEEAKESNTYEIKLSLKDLELYFKDRYDGDFEARYTFSTNIEEEDYEDEEEDDDVCSGCGYSSCICDDNKSYEPFIPLTPKEQDIKTQGFHIRKKNVGKN